MKSKEGSQKRLADGDAAAMPKPSEEKLQVREADREEDLLARTNRRFALACRSPNPAIAIQ
jgi:hypothetical protein